MNLTKVAEDQLLPELVFKWRDQWTIGAAYPVNHLVGCEGSVYISKVDQSAANSTTRPVTGENWTLCWDLFVARGAGAATDLVIRETPSGLIDGVNQVFGLSHPLVAGSEQIFLNGLLQEPGEGADYTISGQTVTFVAAPESGDRLRATYVKS